ncbi:unnamed protein product, partial [Scytosiphon promiscuus]
HLARTRAGIGCVSRQIAPAFLPVCLLAPLLARIERPGFDPLSDRAELSALRRNWILWRASRTAGHRTSQA